MINKASADLIAQKKIMEYSQYLTVPLEVMNDKTIENSHGWLYFYHSKNGDLLAGNCPIFITKDGSLHELPTYLSVEEGLKKLGF